MFTTTSTGELLLQRPLWIDILPILSQDIDYNMKRKKEKYWKLRGIEEPPSAGIEKS